MMNENKQAEPVAFEDFRRKAYELFGWVSELGGYNDAIRELYEYVTHPAPAVVQEPDLLDMKLPIAIRVGGGIFGKGVSLRTVANQLNRIQDTYDDDLNFHDSRHFAATWLSKKIDSLALAKMLGHRDLRMLLNVYYKEDAASLVDKLD